jgi:prephenate dehydrogenase
MRTTFGETEARGETADTEPIVPPGSTVGPPRLERVGIVGSGLIGTSIGLALKAKGIDVLLRDVDPEQARVAERMGAGRAWADERVEHAVVAVPPHAVAGVLRELQQARLADTYSDVASVKTQPIAEAVQIGCDLTTWCPAHPVAGRERGGAISALADLFAERTWVLCPLAHTSPAATAATEALALACGARPLRTSHERHDTTMALLSHIPQVVASMLATTIPEIPPEELALAGQGFRDTTRLADSDPGLWASILEGNRGPVSARLRRLTADFARLADMLDPAGRKPVREQVEAFIRSGNDGRARLPLKADAPAGQWSWVAVVLEDRTGQLGELFTAIGGWEINVEDVGSFEHGLGGRAGIVEIAVGKEAADDLVDRLAGKGWTAYRRS